MGKPTGFIEYLRELPLDRSAVERICDWNEFHQHLDQGKLREQAARCMDCGKTFFNTPTITALEYPIIHLLVRGDIYINT